MATDLEKLVVQLSADIKQYENAMRKATGVTNTQARAIESRFKKMNSEVAASFSGVSAIAGRGLATLGIGIGTAQAVRMIGNAASEYVNLSNQLKVTGLEGQQLESVLGRLFSIAQTNGTAISPLATLYSRAAQAQKELKASSEDLLTFTSGVSLALRVAGTDSQQASGALLQLSQALGSGTVRAEEFNSVNEGARPILQAVAAGIVEAGGSVSKLKTLVTEGKVSSEAFFKGFLAGMPQLAAQAERAQGTVGQAVDRMRNAFTLFIGKLDETTGASKNAAENFTGVAKVIEGLPGYVRAAADSLESLNKWLNEAGNSEFWQKINAFLRARGLMEDEPTTQLRFAAAQGDEAAKAALERKRIIDEIARLETDLADARNTADKTGLDIDRQRVGLVEQRLAALREEQKLKTPAQSPNSRISEFANSPAGRAPAPLPPVSLKDFPVAAKAKSDTVGVDSFERAIAAANKRIAVLNAETGAIDLNAAAQERARVVAELTVAAEAANAAAKMKSTAVTKEQAQSIQDVADRYYAAAEAAERARDPLATFAREGANLNRQFQDAAVGGLRGLEDGLISIADRTATVSEAFSRMAQSIINDLLRIAIRQSITTPICGGFGTLP